MESCRKTPYLFINAAALFAVCIGLLGLSEWTHLKIAAFQAHYGQGYLSYRGILGDQEHAILDRVLCYSRYGGLLVLFAGCALAVFTMIKCNLLTMGGICLLGYLTAAALFLRWYAIADVGAFFDCSDSSMLTTAFYWIEIQLTTR